jgi:hypothetical protein
MLLTHTQNVLSERERRTVGAKVHAEKQKEFLAARPAMSDVHQKALEQDSKAADQDYEYGKNCL